MKKNSMVYLDDILSCIEKIQEYTKDTSFGEFDDNSQLQDSVMRRLEIIGEAAKNLPGSLKNKYDTVPWRQISGMRDVLIHEYAGVLIDRVWKVIEEDLLP